MLAFRSSKVKTFLAGVVTGSGATYFGQRLYDYQAYEQKTNSGSDTQGINLRFGKYKLSVDGSGVKFDNSDIAQRVCGTDVIMVTKNKSKNNNMEDSKD